MSRYRKVDPRIWNDRKFSDLGDRAKLVFFMLLTHPNMTALGAMRSTTSGLAEELGWDAEAFREAFREVIAEGMAEHDQKACMIALPNFIRYNPPESPNVVKAWVGALDLLPECTLKTRVIARSKAFAEGMNKGFAEALPEAFAKGMPYQEQEQEQEQNKTTEADASVVPADESGGDQKPVRKSAIPPCPHEKLIALYHELCPTLDRVKTWTGTRESYSRSRWRETAERLKYTTEAELLGWFREMFECVAMSDFLTGKTAPRDANSTPFKADLEWLLRPKNFPKVIEGRYWNRT